MPTAIRETALAWAKTRLATIAGYTVKRNPRDDLRESFPAIAFFDPPEPAPALDVNDELEREIKLEIGVGLAATGADSGATAGTAINAAFAAIHAALMDASQWASGSVRRVEPGEIAYLDFAGGEQAGETIAVAAIVFSIFYTTKDTDAFTASP